MASTCEGGSGAFLSGAPTRLLLGSIHCHSTLSDGSATPETILARAAEAGLDFLAITDHVPASMDDVSSAGEEARSRRVRSGPGSAPTRWALPPKRRGVLRLPGLEYSPRKNHYLVLGLDPWEAPSPEDLDGWPSPKSFTGVPDDRPGVAGFIAHPDDTGNSFLNIRAYEWDDWKVDGYAGIEVWNLSTDWSRTVTGYRDLLRAVLSGIYRAIPPPSPVTLARWDRLAQMRRVAGIAGTDAHAYPARWHGLRFTVLPYDRAFSSLQTGVWVPPEIVDLTPRDQASVVIDALARGRGFMVNRAWGYPAGFSFTARRLDRTAAPFLPGDTVPAGCPVRFEVSLPWAVWIRLVRNGKVVANTFGRDLSLEPFAMEGAEEGEDESSRPSPPGGEPGPARQEAWRVEAWVNGGRPGRSRSGFYLWILSDFIYRELPLAGRLEVSA